MNISNECDGHEPHEKSYKVSEGGTEGIVAADDELSDLDFTKRIRISKEQVKVGEAVKRLLVDPENKLDHKKSLLETSRLLESARKQQKSEMETVDLLKIKKLLGDAFSVTDIVKALKLSPEVQVKLTELEQSKLFEQLLGISACPSNPLRNFPLDLNSNHYLP